MEILLEFEKSNLQKIRELLLSDEIVSRASIIFKDGQFFGKEKYFCYVAGTEEQINRALELTKETAERSKEEAEIIKKIKEEQEKADKAFGAIFEQS